ncbi:putative baseplate assembly protein, partial [bacterium]|nr:putative baseplate assembly protein [candidate division CSSED10-310 bacterium]
LLPAQPARTWVSFSLVTGAPDNAIVPAGSEIAGKGTDPAGKEKEAPFQTLNDIAVSPSNLLEIVSINAIEDSIFKHTFDKKNITDVVPFEGTDLQEHSIYIAHEDLLNISKNAQINVHFNLTLGAQKNVTDTNSPWFEWEYFNGSIWCSLGNISYDETKMLVNSGKMTIKKAYVGEIYAVPVNKFKKRWIRCRSAIKLTNALPVSLPEIELIQLSVQSDPEYRNEPDMLFYNNYPIDVGIKAVQLKGIDVGKILIEEVKEDSEGQPSFVLRMIGKDILTDKDNLKDEDKIKFENGLIYTLNEDAQMKGENKIEVTFKEAGILKYLKEYMIGNLLTAIRSKYPISKVRFAFSGKPDLPEGRFIYFNLPNSKSPIIFNFSIISTEQDNTIVTVGLTNHSIYNPQYEFTRNYYEDETNDDIAYLVPHIIPFSSIPHTDDIFYMANDEAFSKKNAKITVDFKYHLNGFPVLNKIPKVIIVWEYWNGEVKTWRRLNALDQTKGFTNYSIDSTWQENKLHFVCPSDLAKTKVNGEEKYWIRGRILSGDFGKPFKIETVLITTKDSNGNEFTTMIKQPVESSVYYPIINSIVINYETSPENPQQSISLNNGGYSDLTVRNQYGNRPFLPFEILPEKKDTLFLGFDKQLYGGPLRIFFYLKQEYSAQESAKVAWSYWDGEEWEDLIIDDQTKGFRVNGTIEFFGRRDFVQKELFGLSRFWLKAVSIEGDFPENLAFKGVYFNAVEAIQSSLVKDEPLGASNGLANQKFITLRSPIIEPRVIVREPSMPEEEVLEKIRIEEGEKAYTKITDKGPWDGQVWIQWHRVDDFDETGPDDRHYMVDKRTGEILFGDGKKGMIPPRGTSNIRITYRYGGGAAGNVVPGSVSTLKTTISFLSGVKNPFSAEGGTETETLEQALVRGAESLQHQNRAVTTHDFERIARIASRAVARARCLPNIDDEDMPNPGWITILVVPVTSKRPPELKQELINIVRNGLEQACVGTIAFERRFSIRSPVYVKVRVEAVVVPKKSDEAAEVEKNILDVLNTYLDPIMGGPSRSGWEFGEKVCFSTIISLLEHSAKVDHTVSCKIYADNVLYIDDIAIPPNALVVSDSHVINLMLAESAASTASDQLQSECFKN